MDGKKEEKINNQLILIWLTLIVNVLIILILFFIDSSCQKKLFQDLQKFIELPFEGKVRFIMLIVSALAAFYLFLVERKWIIAGYGITCYYLLAMALRAGLLFLKFSSYVVFFMGMGLVMVAAIATFTFSQKKDQSLLECAKKVIENAFSFQIAMAVGVLLVIVFLQPMPSFKRRYEYLHQLWMAALVNNPIYRTSRGQLCLGFTMSTNFFHNMCKSFWVGNTHHGPGSRSST